MSAPPNVALFLHHPCNNAPAILAGVARYLQPNRRWSIYAETGWTLVGRRPMWLTSCQWDGVLFATDAPELLRLLENSNIPAVVLDSSRDNCRFPSVSTDQIAVGRTAATYYIERGFRHFACCGFGDLQSSSPWWAIQRQDGFRAAIEEKSFSVSIYEPLHGSAPPEDAQQITQWLKAVPKPVAVMACNDQRGLQIVNICRQAGLKIPEEVAVVGVDNNEVICTVSNPPLSSVTLNSERMGYEAAKMLDALMKGQPPAQQRIMINPRGITIRQSSDFVASNNWIVAEAMRFIRENAFRGCKVSDVHRHLRVSLTTLETRFQEELNRSPRDEIHRVQVDEIKKLLRKTRFTLAHIAELTGFEHPEYMSVLFKRITGQTPGAYRKHYQESDIGTAS